MSRYRVVACSTCNKVSEEWRQCYTCLNSWCEPCQLNLELNGTEFQHPPELKGRVKYECPHCHNGFIKDSRFISPFTHKKSKSCTIM